MRSELQTAAGVLASALSCAAAPTYHVVDLGSLGGVSEAFALTGAGAAAGVSTTTGSMMRGFVTPSGGAPSNLGTLADATQSAAFALTESGEAFGVAWSLGEHAPRAFRHANGAMTEIGSFIARAANWSGVAAGSVGVASPTLGWVERACVWSSGVLTELPGLGGDNWHARAINDAGTVVGMSWLTGNTAWRACAWIGGGAHDLGTLGGPTSQAFAVNQSGAVAGVAETAAGMPHACLFRLDAAGSVTARVDMGVLPGAKSSYARGLNDREQAVGTSDGLAMFWRAGAPMTDLNSRIAPGGGWSLADARAINDAGVIAGAGALHGVPRAFLLEPCVGDFNGDFAVTFPDLNILLSNYGQNVPAGESGDATNDGVVTFVDLNIMLSQFGLGCG